MHQSKGHSKDGKGSFLRSWKKLCFGVLSIVSVFPVLKYITSQTQHSLKLPSEADIKASPALNTNNVTQVSNSIMDSDKSPLVNWDVAHEGITLSQTTSVMQDSVCAGEWEKEFLSKPQLFQFICPVFQCMCTVTVTSYISANRFTEEWSINKARFYCSILVCGRKNRIMISCYLFPTKLFKISLQVLVALGKS